MALALLGQGPPSASAGFSCGACSDPEVTAKAKGAWWGDCLRVTTGLNKESKPFTCAFGCGFEYKLSGANSSRIAGHVVGDDTNIKKCSKALLADRSLANSKRTTPKSAAEPERPGFKRARAEAALGLGSVSLGSTSEAGAGSSAQGVMDLTIEDQTDMARARAEMMHVAGVKGLFKHMISEKHKAELDLSWAKAIANCALPPNILENPYFRAAIMLTSQADAPYDPPRRNVMERRLLPTYDKQLSADVDGIISKALCRTLIFDGWETNKLDSITNYLLATELGDLFLDDEDMTGKPKDAAAVADVAIKYMLIAQERYGVTDGVPTTFGVCTDNPSVNVASREMIIEKAKAHNTLHQPYLFAWPCALHAFSSLAGDIQGLPFIKSLLAKHIWIVRKFRRKSWLHTALFERQKALAESFRDSRGRFRALTVKRHGATRIGSVPRSMERNIKLKSALDAVVSLPEFGTKMGISATRDAADLAATAAAAAMGAADDEFEDSDDEDGERAPGGRKSAAESQAEAIKLRATIRSDHFWKDSAEVLSLLSLLLVFLKMVDTSRSLMGWIWPMMFSLHKHMNAMLLAPDYNGRMPRSERESAVRFVGERWAYVHTEVHSAAFAVNPRFHGVAHFNDLEVRDDFISVVTDMVGGDMNKVTTVLAEYDAYHTRTGHWTQPVIWVGVKQIEPIVFWTRWQANSPTLAPLALKWLAAAHAAGSAERNFSLHKRHNTPGRASQKPETLARLVRLGNNQALFDKATGRDAATIRDAQRVAGGKAAAKDKAYPLDGDSDWSSVDESDHEATIAEAAGEVSVSLGATYAGRSAGGAAQAEARDAAAAVRTLPHMSQPHPPPPLLPVPAQHTSARTGAARITRAGSGLTGA